jgi:hypothetical protein
MLQNPIESLADHVDEKTLERLTNGLASLPEPPATIGTLLEYARANDPTDLPGLGRASWAKIEKAIQTMATPDGIDADNPPASVPPLPESDRVVQPTLTVDPPGEYETEEPEAVDPIDTTMEKPKFIPPGHEYHERDLDAIDVLCRRMGIGYFIAERLVSKLTEEEAQELVRAHIEGDHLSYINLTNQLRFRPVLDE